jgi:hypothetical protein
VEEEFCELRLTGVLGSSLLRVLRAVGQDGTFEGAGLLL